MNLNKKIKSLVITYTDEECVRLTKEEADKFREVISEFVSVYNTSSITDEDLNVIDLNSYFNYETIRPALKGSDIETRS